MMWGLKQIGFWDETARHQRARHRRAVLRHVRDQGRQVRLARFARAAVLRGAHPASSASRARACPRRWTGAAGTRCATRFTELFKTKTRDEWDAILLGQRRVLRAGAHDDARRRTTSTSRRARRSSSATACRSPRPRRASRARRPRCSARRRGPASTPTRRSPTGASTADEIAKLRETGAIALTRRSAGVDDATTLSSRASSSAGVGGDGDVAELAARARRLAVVVEVRARRRASTASRSGIAPMQFTIALGPRAAVEPSGQPSTARTWFSNWLVSAPSIVQCPQLCTRGAISLASSSPPTSNSSTQHTPT